MKGIDYAKIKDLIPQDSVFWRYVELAVVVVAAGVMLCFFCPDNDESSGIDAATGAVQRAADSTERIQSSAAASERSAVVLEKRLTDSVESAQRIGAGLERVTDRNREVETLIKRADRRIDEAAGAIGHADDRITICIRRVEISEQLAGASGCGDEAAAAKK